MKAKTDISSKPYNRCLQCRHRHVSCNGLNTSYMSLHEWCEYMRDMKDVNDLTNAEIAESTGISVKTIEKLLALTYDQDIMRETARKIEAAIIGSVGQCACHLTIEENKIKEDNMLSEIDRLRKELEYFKTENDRKARIIDKLLEK